MNITRSQRHDTRESTAHGHKPLVLVGASSRSERVGKGPPYLHSSIPSVKAQRGSARQEKVFHYIHA